MKRFAEFALLVTLQVCLLAGQGVITTITGGAIPVVSPVPATNAPLGNIGGICSDNQGAIYFSDVNHNQVYRVGSDGIIRPVAGNGAINCSGDGGPATAASFISLSSIAVDSNGNIFVSDTLNQRVRKISNTGVMTTVAGTGSSGSSSDGGPAALAQLNYPTGLAVDRSGNLFIVESNGFRVRKVSTSGTISTVAGSGFNDFLGDGGPALSASFYNPYALAIDPSGN